MLVGLNGDNGSGASYDVALFNSLSKASGAPFFDISQAAGAAGFSTLLSETAQSLAKPRRDIAFVTQITGSGLLYRIPISGQKSVVVGVAGYEWLVSVGDPKSLPEETIIEVVKRSLASAHTTMADEKVDNHSKVARLKQIQQTMLNLQSKLSAAQTVEGDFIHSSLATVQQYIEAALSSSVSGTRKSQESLARHATGLVRVQTHRGIEYFPASPRVQLPAADDAVVAFSSSSSPSSHSSAALIGSLGALPAPKATESVPTPQTSSSAPSLL